MSPSPDPSRQPARRQIRPSLCWLALLTVAVVVGLHWERYQWYLIQFAPVATGRRMVRSSSMWDQLNGARVLGAQGPAALAAVPDLIALSQNQNSSPIAVIASFQALARILPQSQQVVDAAVMVLRRNGTWTRIGAKQLVWLVPDNAGAEPALLSLLADEDQRTRAEVADAMASHSPWSASMRSGIAARLEVETNPAVRKALENLVR